MSARNTPDFSAAELAYNEGKDEVKFADHLLEAWAWLSRNTGLPRQTTHCSLGAMVKRDPTEDALAARVQVLDLSDEQFARIDREVGRLPKPLRRVVWTEYWRPGSGKQKARSMSPPMTYIDYRQRLNAAQWALYSALLPDVERWRSLWRR